MSIINNFYQLKTFFETSGNTDDSGNRIIVTDVDAHYAQAIGAGAEIIIDIQDETCGERSYSCRDLQGHIWNFISYNSQDRRDSIEPIY
jgi:uncharacterized glyoxalase superfamily protein PhnB